MKVVIYTDKHGEWRRTFIAGNGRKMADSGESYKRKADCMKSMRKVTNNRILRVEIFA
jgi:uncharacterized protein YegP (UPF0339 family)